MSTHTLCEGNVVLFKRKNSPRWQMRIRYDASDWREESTKQVKLV